MKIKLLAYTPEPEKVVAAAAKLCYSSVGVEEITENLTEEAVEKFLDMLMSFGHQSPVEHVSFTFGIEGVSRVLTHQLVRHRIASYSQQSQRYVKLDQFNYIVPPAIGNNPEAKLIFEKSMAEDQVAYEKLVDLLEVDHYEYYLTEGNTPEKARKLAEKRAIEDARFVFPNACETKIVVTMNARVLLHFLNHRCCNRAQWEIQNLADAMLVELKKVSPLIFNHAGPGCLKGKCPEGAMTCGKINEVRKKYAELS